MKHLVKSIALVSLLVLGVACGGSSGEAAPEPEVVNADLSPCCTEALALTAQMPECCQKGISTVGALTGCCATGMLDETADADRSDCCKKGKALLDQFSPCCKKTVLTGEPGPCCEAMPAAMLAQAKE